jgi:hypothetical protein
METRTKPGAMAGYDRLIRVKMTWSAGNPPGSGLIFVQIFVFRGNPLKYTDPDGRDIYNVALIGGGAKVVVGGGVNFGIAWDDNGNVATTTTLHVGIGVEVGVDTPITPSVAISKGQNINELPGIGPYHYETGTDVTASVGVSFTFNMDVENANMELMGAGLLAIGGSVNKSLTIYFNLNDIPNEVLSSMQDFVQENKDIFPDYVYSAIMAIPKSNGDNQ